MAAELVPHRYEVRSVDALLPHPDNPNRGDPDMIADSIGDLGFFGAVLVQESTGRIIAGEHRWRAAKLAGLAEVPVLVLDADDDLTRKILLSDNQYARLAAWDEDALAALLLDMTGDMNGGGVGGFSADEVAGILARQAEGLPEGFKHLVPLDPEAAGGDGHQGDDPAGEQPVKCPQCGHEFTFASLP